MEAQDLEEIHKSKRIEEHKVYLNQCHWTTKIIHDSRRYEEAIVGKIKSEPQKLYRHIWSQLIAQSVTGSVGKKAGELTKTDKKAADTLSSSFQ